MDAGVGAVVLVFLQHIHKDKHTGVGVCAYTHTHVQTHLHIDICTCMRIFAYRCLMYTYLRAVLMFHM